MHFRNVHQLPKKKKKIISIYISLDFHFQERGFIIIILFEDPFWVEFCERCEACVWVHFGHIYVLLFLHHLLQRLSLSFSIVFPLLLCPRPVGDIHGGLFSELPFLSRWSICLFFHQYHTILITQRLFLTWRLFVTLKISPLNFQLFSYKKCK